MARHGRTAAAIVRRRDDWNAGLLGASARWAERADRCARWTARGVERCRRWAREGAERPGEMAPPSWFHIALPFGIAWYRAVGGTARAWCRVARPSCLILARILRGALTALAFVL
ncbi:hypothetical protein F7Q99_33740 [Streptomyces kaniharaensis]|uniref:Uncharacterized protein n=1 Tax=Streptomyces kaniharaensis TaxID=212423 RepID=A0A6N7L069_9ACTN|nr:hypothetical protein [Streptomyces kaniharaensis]MQS17021.1 hypothetical protein [Streptomyces kaniharaensis]